MKDHCAWLSLNRDAGLIELRGEWVLENVQDIADSLPPVAATMTDKVLRLHDRDLQALDLSGAWLLHDYCRQLGAAGYQIDSGGMSTSHLDFLAELLDGRQNETEQTTLPAAPSNWQYRLHRSLHLAPLVRHIDETGLRAIPIVCLMALMISIVVAYQGTFQLSRFGAEIFMVDLVALSVLREMGVLLTAILVAGRSGSAFAAEIGVMQLNQEVAAMQTLGMDPMRTLLVPRLLALMVTLPMLTLFATLTGLGGGALVAVWSLDIPLAMYMERLQEVASLEAFLVGMSKAPVFAFVIAAIGIRQGFLVRQSASEVGRHTTAAVVQSIFAVIAIDAAFSVATTELGI